MKVYELPQIRVGNLVAVECDELQPRANEVLVKFHAAALGSRRRGCWCEECKLDDRVKWPNVGSNVECKS